MEQQGREAGSREWLALMHDPIALADRYTLLWSRHQAYLALKRAMRRDHAIPRFPALVERKDRA